MVLTRAMSRRTTRTRAVSCNCPLAFWKRRLNRSFRSFRASSFSWSSVITRRSERRPVLFISLSLFRDALHEAGLDRELGGGEQECLARKVLRHAVDLEHDATRRDPRDPEFRRAFAFAHAHFDRLLRHRHIRKHPNPDAPGAFHVAGQRAAGGLDLARRHPLRLERLQAELAEIQRESALRIAVDPAFEGFAELGSLGLHHDLGLSIGIRSAQTASRPRSRSRLGSRSRSRGSRRGRCVDEWSASAWRLSWAIGSCSRISPLKIQTLMPQVP